MNQERMYQVLLGPLVSEKATTANEKFNQMVFKVAKSASKAEIKAAVESIFKVNVLGVQTAYTKGKVKRTAKGLGRRSGVKKAYVTLAEGQSIDLVEVE